MSECEAIVWIKIPDLRVGDIIIEANEVLEVDGYIIETLEHRHSSSCINGAWVHHNIHVPCLESFGGRITDRKVQIVARDVLKGS